MTDEAARDDSPTVTRPPGRTSRRPFWVGLCAGFVLTCGVLIFWRFVRDRQLQPLTRSNYTEALQRWQKNGPASYELEVETTGRQASVYRVVVRQGETELVTRNGVPLPQHRTWFTWTVPGMFETIERDLENVEKAQRGEPGAVGPTVLVFFDPHYGYPARYLRVESLQAASNPEVTWRVRTFQPLDHRPDQR